MTKNASQDQLASLQACDGRSCYTKLVCSTGAETYKAQRSSSLLSININISIYRSLRWLQCFLFHVNTTLPQAAKHSQAQIKASPSLHATEWCIRLCEFDIVLVQAHVLQRDVFALLHLNITVAVSLAFELVSKLPCFISSFDWRTKNQSRSSSLWATTNEPQPTDVGCGSKCTLRWCIRCCLYYY